jgi:hypothetical protein
MTTLEDFNSLVALWLLTLEKQVKILIFFAALNSFSITIN